MRGFAAGGPHLRYIAYNVPGDGAVVIDRETHRMSREYPQLNDAEQTAKWLNDRWRGYASLQRFEGGANWPDAWAAHGMHSESP